MKIAVDGMGGDYAPEAIVEGAVLAAQQYNAEIILVGDEVRLERELDRLHARKLPIAICHASEVVHMDEAPGMALRKKRFSSIRVAIGLVRSGEAQAVVSAGNTGAALAATTMILRPLKGIDRPAMRRCCRRRKVYHPPRWRMSIANDAAISVWYYGKRVAKWHLTSCLRRRAFSHWRGGRRAMTPVKRS
jgi:fatty acid/phospholipid biosynthesis enzyme